MSSANKKLATKSPAAVEVYDDILVDIFLRLPLRSIQRFKTACEHWLSLLSDPMFRKLWRKRNLKPCTGLYINTTASIHCLVYNSFPYSSAKPTNPCLRKALLMDKIRQSCNGLLLCTSGKTYYVYNPTTNIFVALPRLVMEDGTRVHSISLAFDPNKSPYYKVICFIDYGVDVQVYSSDTRCWKPISKSVWGEVNDGGVYWNGAIHWINELSYFDIENEVFKKMPKQPGGRRINFYFGESCDRLNYVKLRKNKEGNWRGVDVFELKRDYSEWVRKHHVKFGPLPFVVTSVLSLVHGAEEEDSFLVLKTEECIARYNLVSQTVEKLPVTLLGGIVDHSFQYIESQCSV